MAGARSTSGSKLGEGALRRGCGLTTDGLGAAGAAGSRRTAGSAYRLGNGSMARLPNPASVAAIFSSPASGSRGSGRRARRGRGTGSENPSRSDSGLGWVITGGSSDRAARAGCATNGSALSAGVKPRDRLATYDSTSSGPSTSARRGRSTGAVSQSASHAGRWSHGVLDQDLVAARSAPSGKLRFGP